MKSLKIFIVEDDPWFGEILMHHLSLNPDFEVSKYTTGKDLLDNLYRNPDIITLDLVLPDTDGLKLMDLIRKQNETVPVIAISGQEDINYAVSILKKGAEDYIIKDENTKDLLWNAIIKLRERIQLKNEIRSLKTELGQKYDFQTTLKGQSPSLKKVFALMDRAITTNINVSITGETGTGKELVAKAIHYNGSRRDKPFIAVNMASIPRELVESELFGHEKGSFTGAMGRKIGKFEAAQGGSIFLDEIAEMDLNMQSHLLRVLQEREIVRVGSNDRVSLDVRLIVATHKNLAEEVKRGTFREDLYYRIIGLPIELPPLRDRGNDILILSKFFAESFAKDNGLGEIAITQSAREKLLRYNFPGNIRELKAIIELAAVLCQDSEIQADDINFPASKGDDTFAAEEKTLREYQCDIIKFYLKKYNQDVMKVARKLDIGKSTIYKMIQDKEIELN